ncbi:MAG: hypothetical protein K9N06_07965 [Candidatus Cloacimonetes bacterium]|nr:hypothetical protein [Candidatus Cloacimonadota bacterium]
MSDMENDIAFLKRTCNIYGKLDNTVYRRKRNGELWEYDYEYVPKYAATVLSRRTDIINKVLGMLTNLRSEDYKRFAGILFYYTPYIIYRGRYSFTANTFYKIFQRSEYDLNTGSVSTTRTLAPRTKLEYNFQEPGSIKLSCYQNNEIFSEREVIVIADDAELETAYQEWFTEHLEEILQLPVPEFVSRKTYRRHLQRIDVYKSLSGDVGSYLQIAKTSNPGIMYVRIKASQSENPQTQYFAEVVPLIVNCWNGVQPEFLEVWNKYHELWYKDNFKLNDKVFSVVHLWIRVTFRAAATLGFDLKTLSPENWLPEVETLDDLLLASEMGHYGLNQAELNTIIF